MTYYDKIQSAIGETASKFGAHAPITITVKVLEERTYILGEAETYKLIRKLVVEQFNIQAEEQDHISDFMDESLAEKISFNDLYPFG